LPSWSCASSRYPDDSQKSGTSEHRLLQIRLHRILADPDSRQRIVEGSTLDRPARFAIEADLRRRADEVDRDDAAFAWPNDFMIAAISPL
jgi:hypothetical protein